MSYEIRSILYASDLTPRSPAVFLHAVGLAKKFNAKLHAVTVTLPSTSLPYEEFICEEKMDEIKLAGHKKAEALLRKRIEEIHRHDFGEVIHVVAGHAAEGCGSVDRHDLVERNRGRPEQANLVTGERGIAANLRVHALDHRPDPRFQRL